LVTSRFIPPTIWWQSENASSRLGHAILANSPERSVA
jgi:hypothetical protein